MERSLLEVERLLWQHGAEVYRRYVLEDAVIVFGEQEAVSRNDAIALLEQMATDGQRWFNVCFNDLQCVRLDNNTAIISYRASGNVRGRNSILSAQCTSLYMRRDGHLRLAFHEHRGPMV